MEKFQTIHLIKYTFVQTYTTDSNWLSNISKSSNFFCTKILNLGVIYFVFNAKV